MCKQEQYFQNLVKPAELYSENSYLEPNVKKYQSSNASCERHGSCSAYIQKQTVQ